jgi:uncharacterized protein YbjT (DUF2867 family)
MLFPAIAFSFLFLPAPQKERTIMKAIVLGSTGMVGKAVLLECLDDNRITKVVVINRRSLNMRHEKLVEVIHDDFYDISPLKDQLAGYDACFFCLGISSVGMSEEKYRRVTYDLTLSFATTYVSANPAAVFCYVSGTGTDSSEHGKLMWARVKGKTENDLLKIGFRDAYMFRPGYIQPLKGVRARSAVVNVLYFVLTPLYYILKAAGSSVTDSVSLGKAMICAAINGYSKKIIEPKDINVLARAR